MSRSKKPPRVKRTSAQQYDTTFKDWIRKEAYQAVPLLIEGAICDGLLDREIILPTKRADQILRLIIDEEIHIGNIEFQTSYEDKLLARLLIYHAVLYYDYGLPVYSMIIYPFKTKIDEPPFTLFSAGRDRVIFHYEYLKLYDLNAEKYVQDKSFCMYPLLPAMQGVDHRLLKQAMDELTNLYHDDETSLADRYLWMQVLIARSDTIDLEERFRIQQELHMYDPLLENHPKVKRIRAEGEAKGLAEGEAKGELITARKMFVNVVRVRFPTLAELAQQEAMRIHNPETLDLLTQKVVDAANEEIARWLLALPR